MIIRDNILTLWEVSTFIDTFGCDLEGHLRDILLDKNSFVYSNEERSITILIERLTMKTARVHIYASPGSRGRTVLNFVDEVWVEIRKTPIKYVFNYTKDLRVMFLMGSTKRSRRLGVRKGNTIYRTEV